jgi:hypothetical protein
MEEIDFIKKHNAKAKSIRLLADKPYSHTNGVINY